MLDARDSGILEALVGAVLVQSSVDLARAENDTIDFVRLVDALAVFRIRDDPFELGIAGEFFDGRPGERVTKEAFGEEEDES